MLSCWQQLRITKVTKLLPQCHYFPCSLQGISICLANIHEEQFLVAFGGYNGNYNNEVLVMRPKLKDPARPKIYLSPAAAAAAASVTTAYSYKSDQPPELPKQESVYPKQDGSPVLANVKDAKRLLELSLIEVREENSMLKGKIDEINSNHEELSKELTSVQGQLISERSRCFKLEAQIAELERLLESRPSIDTELQSLRKEKSTFEQFLEHDPAVQRQGSRGVWQWFSGGEGSP